MWPITGPWTTRRSNRSLSCCSAALSPWRGSRTMASRRGSAGAGSFRRGATLRECLRQARQQVTRTAKQTAAPLNARVEAAQRRADGERLARVDEALAQWPAVQAIKDRQSGTRRREARVSTTDPDARVMKMADGGYRPAYNVHLVTDVDSRVIVGVRTINSGNDQSQLGPMLDAIAHRLGQLPRAHLLDGGFVTKAEIMAAAARSVTVYVPPMQRPGRTRAADQPVPGDCGRRRAAGAHGERRGRRSTKGAQPRRGSRRMSGPIAPWDATRAGNLEGAHWARWLLSPKHDAHDGNCSTSDYVIFSRGEHRCAADRPILSISCTVGSLAPRLSAIHSQALRAEIWGSCEVSSSCRRSAGLCRRRTVATTDIER